MTGQNHVTITVRADRATGPYEPIWNWFGYDEPNYTYSTTGKKLLRDLAALSESAPYVRTHNLLTSGDGTPALKWGSTNAYTEDENGRPVYDWTIMDRIFDAYVEAGITPLIQVGFTPEALSDDPGPYQHSWSLENAHSKITTGWAAPPNDLKKWGDLVHSWARHLADRCGEDKVLLWPWEVWNEPDGLYWTGTIPEFCAMYDVTARAIRQALPGARVGGPHTCGAADNPKAQKFLREFLQHVTDNKSPIDFIAFHAKGQPEVHDGHVRMGVSKQLRDIDASLTILAEFPELAKLPVVVGESDPEGCAACSARVHPQNAYRNGPLYGVYVAESMLRTYELSRRSGIRIEGAVTWAFQFDGQPYFDGFRDLATNGINKAVLNAFRMLGKLGGVWIETTSTGALSLERIMADGVREQADVNAVATRDESGVSILVYNYHDDDVPGDIAAISVVLNGVPANHTRLRHFRMDEDHSNAFGKWKEMGSPQDPDSRTYRALEAASELSVIEDREVDIAGGNTTIELTLPRQGVSLLRLGPA